MYCPVAQVRYGSPPQWSEWRRMRRRDGDDVPCGNELFGDPYPGVGKTCQCQPPPAVAHISPTLPHSPGDHIKEKDGEDWQRRRLARDSHPLHPASVPLMRRQSRFPSPKTAVPGWAPFVSCGRRWKRT